MGEGRKTMCLIECYLSVFVIAGCEAAQVVCLQNVAAIADFGVMSQR
jgi:hypothetical protein